MMLTPLLSPRKSNFFACDRRIHFTYSGSNLFFGDILFDSDRSDFYSGIGSNASEDYEEAGPRLVQMPGLS